MKLRQKLIGAIAFSVILPTLIIATVSITKTSSQSKDYFISATQNEIRQINNSFNVFFQQIKSNAKFLANNPIVANAPKELSTYFGEAKMIDAYNGHPQEAIIFDFYRQFGDTHDELLYVYLGTENGGFIQYPAAKVGNYDPRKRPWYKQGQSITSEAGITDAYQGVTGGPMVSVMYPINNNRGSLVGVQSLDVSLTTLTDVLQSIKLGETGYLLLIEENSQGDLIVLADPQTPDNNFKKVGDISSELYQSLSESLQASASSNFIATHNNEDVQVTTYHSKELDWHFVGVISRSEILSPAFSMSTVIVALAIIMVLVFVGWGVHQSKQLVAPILVVSKGLRDIANGKGDLTQRLVVNSNDETGELAKWFNQFIDSIRSLVDDINEDSQLLANKSKLIGENVRHIKSASQTQEVAIENSSQGTSVMAGNALEVANNCSSTQQLVAYAETASNEGMVTVSTMVNQVSSLSNSIHESAAAIKDLEKESDNITQILGVIRSIAEQTNLLALNAAIEAARAGDQGRGFAVVADEVRTLAQSSHEATEEIDALLNSLMDKTHFVSNKMHSSLSQSEQATSQSTLANQSFEEINASVVSIRAQLDDIAQSANTQNQNSQQINTNIAGVKTSMSGITSSSETLATNARELMELSNELNGLVGQFKIH